MTIDRRGFLLSMASGAAAMSLPALSHASVGSAHRFSFTRMNGMPMPLGAYRGRPLLIVNTASFCGLKGQLGDLETVWQRYQSQGLMVIGVPSDSFGGQESSDPNITMQEARKHGVTFELTQMENIRGADAHPFSRWAVAQDPANRPRWNFHKYLIDANGEFAGSFESSLNPLSDKLLGPVEQLLQSA